MRDWLEYFFLSFFTDKNTHEAHKRSLLNAFGCFFLSLVILLGFLFGGYMAAMPAHYRNAIPYREALYEVLGNPDYIVKSENGMLSVTDQLGSAVVVNTFADQTESECELIIDTRDIKNIFVEFTVEYTSKDGAVLSYDAYLALADEEKADCTFSVTYTGVPITFTDNLLLSYEQYLDEINDEALPDLMERKQELSEEAYAVELYKLYVNAYYPADVQALDLYTFAPTVRTYYDDLIAKVNDAAFFAMYNDFVYTRFFGDRDICYTASASSVGLEDRVLSRSDVSETQAQIDRLIQDAFRSSANTIVIEYIFNFVKLCSLLILGSLLFAVLPWLLFKLTKNHKYSAYLTSFQILHLYTPMAAVISGFVGFVLSWFTGRNTTYQVAALCYAAVVSIRMTLYTLRTLSHELKH